MRARSSFRALSADACAARRLTEQVLLPVPDAAVSLSLVARRAHGFEKHDVVQEVFHNLYENDWARLRGFDPARGSVTNHVGPAEKAISIAPQLIPGTISR